MLVYMSAVYLDKLNVFHYIGHLSLDWSVNHPLLGFSWHVQSVIHGLSVQFIFKY